MFLKCTARMIERRWRHLGNQRNLFIRCNQNSTDLWT